MIIKLNRNLSKGPYSTSANEHHDGTAQIAQSHHGIQFPLIVLVVTVDYV